MIIINSIVPLFFLMLLGRFFMGAGLVPPSFFKTSDRLVYYVFFPIMLFWKLGEAPPGESMDQGLCICSVLANVIIYCAMLFSIKPLKISRFQAGSFIQTGVRFNSYVGMAVLMTALGDEGMRHFGFLSGFVIPVINVLCVSTLIWFSDLNMTAKEKIVYCLKAVISNPLILSCIAGMGFAATGLKFPAFVHNSFSMVTAVTLPLALMSIGAGLKFKGFAEHLRVSIWGSLYKLLVFPIIGIILLKIFRVSGAAFTTGMVFFCLPTAAANYVLSSQLHSDTDLASVSIMITTLLSVVPLSIALIL